MSASKTRSCLEIVWRVIRLAALTFAHGSWAVAVVHSSTSAKLGAVGAAVGVSEAIYRKTFPQGSRRVSGWAARALVIVQKIAAEAPVIEAAVPSVAPAVSAVVADVATVEAAANVPEAVRVDESPVQVVKP